MPRRRLPSLPHTTPRFEAFLGRRRTWASLQETSRTLRTAWHVCVGRQLNTFVRSALNYSRITTRLSSTSTRKFHSLSYVAEHIVLMVQRAAASLGLRSLRFCFRLLEPLRMRPHQLRQLLQTLRPRTTLAHKRHLAKSQRRAFSEAFRHFGVLRDAPDGRTLQRGAVQHP